MPQKEIDIIIHDGDIEQSEKKLRNLDKLLQQTQRRAAVLGRTRMTPIISLDDRFSTKARLIAHRMTLLDRMSANPAVWLIDNASAGINKIRDSLSLLTQTPWRVTISGPNWDVVTGTSFTNLLGDESLYTEVGKKAGETYFEAFLATLDPQKISDKLNQATIGSQGVGSDSQNGNGSKGLIGWILDFGKELGSALLVEIILKKFGGKWTKFGDSLNKKVTPGKVKDPLKSSPKTTPKVPKSASKSVSKVTPMTKMKTASKELFETTSEKISKISSKVASKIGFKGFPDALGSLKEFGGKLSSRLVTYGKQGSKILSKAGPFAKGLLGSAGMLLTIKNTQEYMDNTGISDLVRKAPKMIWDDWNAPPRTEVNGKPVQDMGLIDYSIELGKETYNRITNKETWKTYGDVLKSMGSLFSRENLGILFLGKDVSGEVERIRTRKEQSDQVRTNQILKNSDSPVQFPTNQSVPGIYSNDIKQEVDNSVNVSVTPGAINLTIHKDEINYDDIAQKTGSMIANQVRFAMMNMS